VEGESKKGFKFIIMGIILCIFFVIISIIWITMLTVSEDEVSGEDITWVG